MPPLGEKGALYVEQRLIINILLDEVFVISGLIKAEVKRHQPSRRPRLITLTETLIIPDITKTECNTCFITHCFEENNKLNKHTVTRNLN